MKTRSPNAQKQRGKNLKQTRTRNFRTDKHNASFHNSLKQTKLNRQNLQKNKTSGQAVKTTFPAVKTDPLRSNHTTTNGQKPLKNGQTNGQPSGQNPRKPKNYGKPNVIYQYNIGAEKYTYFCPSGWEK